MEKTQKVVKVKTAEQIAAAKAARAAKRKATQDAKNAPKVLSEAEKKALEKQENAADKAAILKNRESRKNAVMQERQTVRELIKKLPEISIPICTESAKPAIDAAGKQLTVNFALSNLSRSIGQLIDKANNSDLHLYFHGAKVTLPGKGAAKARYKAFILSLVSAAFAAGDAGQPVILSMREKFDFRISDNAGNFAAAKDEVLRAIETHNKAANALERLKNFEVDNFGRNPEKKAITKQVASIFKAAKNEDTEALNKARSSFNLQSARLLLS